MPKQRSVNKLEEIDLSHNSLKSLPIRFIFHLPRLKALNLAKNEISNLNFLDNDSELETLDLSYNKVDKLNKRVVLSKLSSLDISYNLFKDCKDFDCNLPNLERLGMKGNKAGFMNDLRVLERCDNLYELDIRDSPLYYNGIEESISQRFPSLHIANGKEIREGDKEEDEFNQTMVSLGKYVDQAELEKIEKQIENELEYFSDDEYEENTNNSNRQEQFKQNEQSIDQFYETFSKDIRNYQHKMNVSFENLDSYMNLLTPNKASMSKPVDNKPAESEINKTKTSLISNDTNSINKQKPQSSVKRGKSKAKAFRIKQNTNNLSKWLLNRPIKNKNMLKAQNEYLKKRFNMIK